MIEIQIKPGEPPWYGACYRWPTGDEARAAWVALNDLAPEDGSWHVGIYRHQRVGKDTEPVLVSVVGDLRHGVEAAEISLRVDGGEETELHDLTWRELLKRRVEMILKLSAEGAGYGRHSIPHAPGGDTLS
jgi:hypothetical protein